MVNEIIDSEPVQQAVRDEAQRTGASIERAELGARRMAVEIASDYSYPFIRAYDIALTALWNRLYDGVEVHRFETIASAGTGAEIVYLPCHRSHIDYLLLSYVIYHRGLLPPHIAAGAGFGVTVASTAQLHRHPDVRYVPVADAPPVPLLLAWPRRGAHPVLPELRRVAVDAFDG